MEEFYINDDGIRLHAKLDMPEGSGKCPLVILVHGFTGHMEERHIIAVQQAMNEIGFAVLRAEMYGHGKSDGLFEDHTLFKWITNIMTVTEYAKSLPFVTDLYLCGHSQGGLLTILAAGMRPDDYRAIIPMSPALSIPEGAREGNLLGMPFDPAHIPEVFEFPPMRLKGNYIRCAQMIWPEDAIARYTGPVLITHGSADQAIPLRYSEEAEKQYADCRLVILEDDSHGYDLHLDWVCSEIQAFLKENS